MENAKKIKITRKGRKGRKGKKKGTNLIVKQRPPWKPDNKYL